MKWIKTSEQLPEDFTELLCTDGKHVYFAEYTSQKSDFNKSKFILCKGVGITEPFDYYHSKEITHWMNLPKLPKN
jgi:hypothetical protein